MKIDSKRKGLLFGLITVNVILLICFLPTLVQGKVYCYGGDLIPQHFQFYTEFKNLITQAIDHGKLPFYSWSLFLGNNFYASKAYYVMGDIYAYLSLFWTTDYFTIFVGQCLLKVSVAFSAFYALSLSYKYSPRTSYGLGLLYAFSSWLIFFIAQPMFASFYSFMPLYFLGMERFLQRKGYLVFLLSTSLCLFTNYYLFFTISLFSPLYYLMRYYLINKSYQGVLKSCLSLIGIYFVGCLVTSVLIIPAGLYIMGNDRVGDFQLLLTFDQLKIYFHQLQAVIFPSQLIIYQPFNIFETGKHITRELCVFAGCLTALLVPQILTDQNKQYRRTMIIVYLILIVSLIIPTGSMIFMGFSTVSFRWTILLIILNLLVAGRYLNDLSLINLKNLKITVIAYSLILLFNYPLVLLLENRLADFNGKIVAYLLALACLVIYWLNYYILQRSIKQQTHHLLLLLIVSEVLLTSFIVLGIYRLRFNTTFQEIEAVTHTLQSEDGQLNNYLASLDENAEKGYYRVYVPHSELYWNFSHNQSIFYQLAGVMTYDSTYAPSFNELKNLVPEVKDFSSEWIFNIKNQNLLNFLSVKYAIVTSFDQLPDGDYELIDDQYQYGLLVYKNLAYQPILTNYDHLLKYSDVLNDSRAAELLSENLIVADDDYAEIKDYVQKSEISLNNAEFKDNHMYLETISTNESLVVLKFSFDPGWTLTINGQPTKIYQVNGGMMGFVLPAGENYLYLNFIPQGFKLGLILSMIGIGLSFCLIFWQIKQTRKNKKKNDS